MMLLIIALCISLVLSLPSSSSSSSSSVASSVASSEVDYNNLVGMISSMNEKEKATLLEVVTYATGSTNSTSTSTTSGSVEYDMFSRRLQSSASIKVTGSCDDQMLIYINGVIDETNPMYFNPATDTLAIRGLDGGGFYGCVLYFNDVRIPVSIVQNHFKCTYKDYSSIDLPAGWMAKDFDDSEWGGVYTTWGDGEGWWAEGLTHAGGGIFCRYHPEGTICKEGSEIYEGNCWCGKGYKSSNGMAPCEPCDDNAYTDRLGSTVCKCAANAFSSNGYDTPNSCESCPG